MRAGVRYIVDDVDAAVDFYRDRLGFNVDMHPAPGLAGLSRDDLTIFLNALGAPTRPAVNPSRAAGTVSGSKPTTSMVSSRTSGTMACRSGAGSSRAGVAARSWPRTRRAM